ncbi:MAG: DJ-1/PfpI family protein [Erythrobacter sp.]|uniref:DJ-1/PfpI family protein n=1 Tax=Erythrobacter sp. TaxID=1042 RepID=UPI002639A9CE|nr:DJ-1/PfpI family protein [Erythrobacter sp.]MDJ0977293.1 DJ-1/PfpI family protein [Erythrobacter sp.]
MQRRDMIRMMSALAATGALAAPAFAQGDAKPTSPDGETLMDMSKVPPSWFGNEQVAVIIYDNMTALDVIGPQYFLSGLFGATVHMVAKTDQPITSDSGITITPTATFETCPRALDILLVGGGVSGTLAAMRDDVTLDFLADRGSRAKWVTSVCTGSLLLGQAGLLKGYRATSHWIGRPLLNDFGAIEVNERMVFDRNRATGAGVSAGLDLGLELMHRMRPLDLAQAMQVMAEYAPEPPLDFGTPEKVPSDVLAGIEGRLSGFTDAVRATARTARI